MNSADYVNLLSALHKGEDVKIGDYIIRLNGGGELDFTTKEKDGDLHLTFMGKRPIAQWFVFKGYISGFVICVKGVRVDIVALPRRADPFISWEDIISQG